MVKPELGTKRVCVNCAAKFYDLGKVPAVCPKCDTEQPAEQPRIRRGGGNVAEEKRRAKVIPVPGADDAEAEPEAAEDEAEEDVLDDAADLDDEDPEAIAEVEVDSERGEEER